MFESYSRTIFYIFPLFAMAVLGGSLDSAVAQTPSFFERGVRGGGVNLFGDVKARQPGDLLTVIIEEKSKIENKDNRLLRKSNSANTTNSGDYTLSGGIGTGVGSLTANANATADRDFQGDTRYKSERDFSDRFTVSVVDRLQNGNLLIRGKRMVSMEGDGRELILTGIVRSVDISVRNQISSKDIADLEIRYATDPKEGVEKHFFNQGWLGRKFNRWWPY
ncbi:MAG: flagellar basal body L-ring protein FlgH [Mariniblastus sp.]|nr:flagellar basal body L-ring protein FlgH [Mariniblastus sp.]